MEIKIAATTRVFHQITRLLNTKRGLSFQVMRQLYIICIILITDYGVPIWWNNQKYLLEKYQKLQNLILKKILGAFKTSLSMIMKLEAVILLFKVRFNRVCKNYTLRILQVSKSYLLKLRILSSFLPYDNRSDLD